MKATPATMRHPTTSRTRPAARPHRTANVPVRTAAGALGLLLVSLAASPASAKVIWRGDFETGDLSQWSKTQMVSKDRLEVVGNPVKEGQFALKTTVRSGDDPIGASGNRNELVIAGIDKSGSERVYRWSTMFPKDFESADTWHLFTQWHHDGSDGSPPVEFFVWGETIFLRVDGEDLWSTPLVRGKWQEFVFSVKWARNGWVELRHNGKLVLEKTSASTLYAGQGVYLKQGLYRHASVSHPQVVYHDGMTVAESLDDLRTKGAGGKSAGKSGGRSGDSGDAPEFIEGPNGEMMSATEAGCTSSGLAGVPALLTLLAGAVYRHRKRRQAKA